MSEREAGRSGHPGGSGVLEPTVSCGGGGGAAAAVEPPVPGGQGGRGEQGVFGPAGARRAGGGGLIDAKAGAGMMLEVYILDYLRKKKLHAAAAAFQTEAEVPDTPPGVDAPTGFLCEWWSVFWEIFNAKANPSMASDAANAYVKAQLKKQGLEDNRSRVPAGGHPGQWQRDPAGRRGMVGTCLLNHQ